jgi:hypothetical protein
VEDGSEKDTDNSWRPGGDNNYGSHDGIRTSSVDAYQTLNVEKKNLSSISAFVSCFYGKQSSREQHKYLQH